MENIYSNQSIPGFKSYNNIIASANIACGIITVLLCLLWIVLFFTFYRELGHIFTTMISGERLFEPAQGDDFVAALKILSYLGLVFASFYFGIFGGLTLLNILVKAWKKIGQGVFQLLSSDHTGIVPGDFADQHDVAMHLSSRQVYTNKEMGPYVNTIYGRNINMLSPVAGQAIEPMLKSLGAGLIYYLKPVLLGLLFFGIALYFRDFFPEFTGEIKTAIVSFIPFSALISTTLLPALAVVLALVCATIAKHISVKSIVPSGAPLANVGNYNEQLKAEMHPRMLADQFRAYFDKLEWKGFPNRYSSLLAEQQAISVSDSGEFEIEMLIEQQPQPMKVPYHKSGYIIFFSGWGLRLLGIAILLFAIFPREYVSQLNAVSSTDAQSLLSPFYVILWLWAAIHLLRQGQSMIESGSKLLNAYWFYAPLIFINLRGNISKGQAKIGKAVDESMETTTEHLRSDFFAQVWAAEAVSETDGIDGERLQIAFTTTRRSSQWLEYADKVLRLLSQKRVQAAAIDLSDEGARDMMNANAAAQAAKAGLVKAAQLQAETNHATGLPSPLPGETRQITDDNTDDTGNT